jgi:hypothetical protein
VIAQRIARPPLLRFNSAMPQDPYIREKFTRERTAAKKLAVEYFKRFPKERYQTEVESWRNLQSQNIEFTMKRLREPIETATGDR